MRKRIFVTLIALCMAVVPVHADPLEDRIAALEARVDELERIIAELTGGGEIKELAASGEAVELGVGSWIVGEDMPSGRCSIKCTGGYGAVYVYASLENMKSETGMVDHAFLVCEEYADVSDIVSIDSIYLEEGYCVKNECKILVTPVG